MIIHDVAPYFVTKKAAGLFGYNSPEDLINSIKDIEELFKEEYRVNMKERSARRYKTKETSIVELVGLRKDGTEVPLLVGINVTNWKGEPAIQCTYYDVTELKKTQKDLEERIRTEEALQNAHDELEQQVAERTSELAKAYKQLETKAVNLEETNIALKVLLQRRDDDKNEVEEKILLNVKELIIPYLHKFKKSSLNDRQNAYADILESGLNNIISPFLHTLSSKYSSLTPKEIQVANLVKEGKTTKDISELLSSSTDTIDFHRKNIRKKLGLQNTKTNLRSYLLSFS